METHYKQVARILVEVNIREGLPETIDLDWGPDIITQPLDYENVPFWCRRCHAYGHPVSECHLPLCTLNGGKRKVQQVASEGEHIDLVSTDPTPVTEGSGCEKISEDSDPFSQDTEGEPDVRADSPPAPADVVALTAPVKADVTPGPPIPGISTYSLSPSINL